MVVELPTTRLVMLASVATRDEKNPLVEVALDAIRLVVEAFVIVALVVVELPTMSEAMFARVATKEEKNPLVLVELVEKRSVAVRTVAEAVLRVVWPDTVSRVIVVVAKVEVPRTI